MGLIAALKTLFGTSDEEKELRRQTEEAIAKRKDRTTDIAEARARLEKAQQDVRTRAEEIRNRQDNIHDEETPRVRRRTSEAGA